MTLRAAMVLTTIADPVLLEGYCANFAAYGRLKQVQLIWIPTWMRVWLAACRELAAV